MLMNKEAKVALKFKHINSTSSTVSSFSDNSAFSENSAGLLSFGATVIFPSHDMTPFSDVGSSRQDGRSSEAEW